MAKKIYHIPLDDTRVFIKENKADINKLLKDNQYLQYNQRFGKAHYDTQIEEFVNFFKIYKNLSYSLKTINYLSSLEFLENIFMLLNFNQFEFDKSKATQKDFFYGFCYILYKNDSALFCRLLETFFAHFHSSLNNNTNINIDFKDMAQELAKTKKLNLKESFGEEDKTSYFKISIDDSMPINLKGKSIKTLRKKAYKELFYYLLDFDKDDEFIKSKTGVYNLLEQMKSEC